MQTSHKTIMLAVLAIVAAAACAPDPEPIVGGNNQIQAPDLGGDDPDTGSDPDMNRPGDPDMSRDPDMATDTGSGADMTTSACATSCANGECVVRGEEEFCACDPRWAGADCGECEVGYAGAACDECDAGFADDPLNPGACVPDPCLPDPCNGHGACFPQTDAAGAPSTVCRCDPGFTGDACDACDTGYTGVNCDECARGYTLDNGLCVLVACSPAPCDHGLCLDADGNGTPECVCETGWTGRDCGTCAPGYIDDAGQCIPDVCAGVTCVNGACVPGGTVGMCACDPHYTGAMCDTCEYGYTEVTDRFGTTCQNELPVRDTRLKAWFDAKAPLTMDLDPSGGVLKWRSRWNFTVMNQAGPDANRTRYILLPTPGVEFDGNDTMWMAQTAVGVTNEYTVIVVATWDPAGSTQTLVETYYQQILPYAPYRIEATNASTVRFHHWDKVSAMPDTVENTSFAAAMGPQMIIAQRGPFLNGTAQSLSNGGTPTTMQATNAGLPEVTSTQFGSAGGTGWGQQGLDGRLHEVIFFTGTLSAAERDAIEAYLEVKWGL